MQVILKYRRGPRPRGSWRFPLWLVLGVKYDPAEIEQLNPDWLFDQTYRFKLPAEHSISAQAKRKAPAADTAAFPCFRPALFDGKVWSCWDFNCDAVRIMFSAQREEPPYPSSAEHTLFFSHQEDRDAFIKVLHHAREDLLAFADQWWHENAPVYGDAIPHEQTTIYAGGQVYHFGTDNSAAEGPLVEEGLRRIRPAPPGPFGPTTS